MGQDSWNHASYRLTVKLVPACTTISDLEEVGKIEEGVVAGESKQEREGREGKVKEGRSKVEQE